MPCDYLSCLSKKKRKGKKRRRRRNKQRKTDDNPKTPDLTSREFFKTGSGTRIPKEKQKHRQNSTKTHRTNTDTQKQKFAPENFFKQRPSEKKNGKITTKDTEPDTKNKNEKNGQHFPLREGGKACNSSQECVTARLQVHKNKSSLPKILPNNGPDQKRIFSKHFRERKTKN